MFLFNLLSSVDLQTQQLLNNLMDVLLPILYAIAGFALAFSIIKYSWKIHNDPENKSDYLRHMVTSVIACGGVLIASGIARIIFCKNVRNIIVMKFMFLDTFGIGHAIWKLLYDILLEDPYL